MPSIYHTEADLIEDYPILKTNTYSFEGANTCRDIGMQVLLAAQWRPDRARAQPINVRRLPAPRTSKGGRILIGPPEENKWLDKAEVY